MFKFYKGNPIKVTKSINGRGSFVVKFTLCYRYSFFKFRKYNQSVTLSDVFTMKDAYDTIKKFIDDLDKIVKL